jgi:ATP phosphoribosyltransferase regulatory subunit
LKQARLEFAEWPEVLQSLQELEWLADHADYPVSIDLADLRGYAYYSGPRFSIFVPETSDALVRGGRYDEVGAIFGRKRPAVGFSLDIKALVGLLPHPKLQAAIRAPLNISWALSPGACPSRCEWNGSDRLGEWSERAGVGGGEVGG